MVLGLDHFWMTVIAVFGHEMKESKEKLDLVRHLYSKPGTLVKPFYRGRYVVTEA